MDPADQEQGRALERFADYLALLARLRLGPGLQEKVDVSAVVGHTLREAGQAWDLLRRLEPAEQAAWLQNALVRHLGDEVGKLRTPQGPAPAQTLPTALEESWARLGAWLATEPGSPGEQAAPSGPLLRLAHALAQLPPDQRVAVELYHLRGLSLAEVAGCLGSDREAAALLLYRGLDKLCALLGEQRPE